LYVTCNCNYHSQADDCSSCWTPQSCMAKKQ